MKRKLTPNGLHAIAAINLGFALTADAAIVYSGVVNLLVPASIDGVYLDVVTGLSSSNPNLVQGWDINPYQSSSNGPTMSFFSATTAASGNAPASSRGYLIGNTGGTGTGPAMAIPFLALEPTIGPAGTYNTGIASGINFTSPGSHYLGFRFQNEENGNAINYGWARIERPGDAGIAKIVDYAYDNSGATISLPVFIPPEPGSLALLALGAPGLLARRRESFRSDERLTR